MERPSLATPPIVLHAGRTGRGRALAATAIVLAAVAANAWRFPGTDFGVYHRAGERFLRAAALYGDGVGFARYRYLPGVGALLAPLAVMPYDLARHAWLLLSLALALAASAWMLRALAPSRSFAVPLAWACLFHPLAQELQLGQVHLAVLGLLAGAFALDDRDWPLSAGALLALAAALKVAPALLLVDAALRRRWRILAGFAAGLAALVAATALRYGVGGAFAQHVAWWESQRALTAALVAEPMNQSVVALVRASGGGVVAAALAALAIAGAALSARPLPLRRALCVAAVVLATPNGWVQGFVLAAPVTALLLAGPVAPAIAGGALALGTGLLAYDVLGAAHEAWVLQHRLIGLDVLALFALGRAVGGRCLPRESRPRRGGGRLRGDSTAGRPAGVPSVEHRPAR